jgi:hypothetical protein
VPIPLYIRKILVKREQHHNIFSGKPQPLNPDYFKTLWSRFKKQSKTLEQGQRFTLLDTLQRVYWVLNHGR